MDARRSNRPLTDDERRELVVTLHAGAVGAWNWDSICNWDVAALKGAGMDADLLKGLQTDAHALAAMLEADKPVGDAEIDPGRADEYQKKWDTGTGQLWAIGEHRLLIGDSTVRADVEKVMGGEKADLVFTDPPYNVSSNSRNYAADGETTKKTYQAIKSSDWDKNFNIKPALENINEFAKKDSVAYICTSHFLIQTIWDWANQFYKFNSYIVWCKPNPTPSLSKRHWTFATELIVYATRGKFTCNFPSRQNFLSFYGYENYPSIELLEFMPECNYWILNKETHSEEHPTQKPLKLVYKPIAFSSKPKDIVMDLFLGSGTTMVVCQNLGRRCMAIEKDINWAAVVLERMSAAFPGIDIRRIDA